MNDVPLQPGDVVGRYKVMEQLGNGRWGALYKARSLAAQTYHVLRLPSGLGPAAREALRREVRLQQALTHPNVVPIAEIVETGTIFALVTEWVEGTCLRDVLADADGMDLGDVMPLFLEILDAVRTAHTMGLVHESLTPGDVLLAVTQGGVTARVTEFGLWRALGGADGTGQPPPSYARYLAPELFVPGARLDARTDVFSLGCVLYEMLTGHAPFAEQPRLDPRGGPAYEPLAAVMADCPLALAAAVERALELDPEYRYPDIASFARGLFGTEEPESEPQDAARESFADEETEEATGAQRAPEQAPPPNEPMGSSPPAPLPTPPVAPAPPVTPAPVPAAATPAPPVRAEQAEPDPAWQGVSWAVRFVIAPAGLIGGVVLLGAYLDGAQVRAARGGAELAAKSVEADLEEQIASAQQLVAWGAPEASIKVAVEAAEAATTPAARLEADDKLSEVLLRDLKLLPPPPTQAEELTHRAIERMLITDREHLQGYREALAAQDAAESRPFAGIASGLGFAGPPRTDR